MILPTGLTRSVGALAVALALAGCATGANPADPMEGFNRAMFSFNDTIDRAAFKPAATAYQNYLPVFMQNGIGNFFGNLGDVWTGVNNLLQGKAEAGVTDILRFSMNSTFGLGGFVDIAGDLGMAKHKQDFGATLGVWGVGSGPYVVLPFLGSTTLRDTAALPADFTADLWQYAIPVSLRNTGTAVRVVDQRAVVLNASNLIEDAALDRYEFIRDAYLQRRENQITGGEPRRPKGEDSDTRPETTPDTKPDAKPDAKTSGFGSGDVTADTKVTSPNPEEPSVGLTIQLSEMPAGQTPFNGNAAGLPDSQRQPGKETVSGSQTSLLQPADAAVRNAEPVSAIFSANESNTRLQ